MKKDSSYKHRLDTQTLALLEFDRPFIKDLFQNLLSKSNTSIMEYIDSFYLLNEIKTQFELGELHPSDIFTPEQLASDSKLEVDSKFIMIGTSDIMYKASIKRVSLDYVKKDILVQTAEDLFYVGFEDDQSLLLEFNRVKSILYRY
tara:strand:- start:597 stop:1034 length:438 start_codon:yes stop_codon:yes gene_type:complete